MSTENEKPTHDQSADAELSESLAGHADLPEGGDSAADEKLSESLAGHAHLPEGGDVTADEPLEEIDGSPVRTKNS